MTEDSHASMRYNSGSPSSDSKVVAKIVQEFIKASDSLALDIGGTKLGFIGHMSSAKHHGRVVLVNKEGGDEITWRSVGCVPDEERYDLVMMFGTAMYMDQTELRQTFEKALTVLKPGGTFLISDINGSNPAGRIELGLKYAWMGVRIIAERFGYHWRPMPLHLHTRRRVARDLVSVGFSFVKNRPDLKARSGWYWWIRWVLYIIQPTRYYVLSGMKASAAASSLPTAAPAPASVTRGR